MKLRYFFDAGSGVCLWSADDEARNAYDYPVDLELLPLSKELKSDGYRLIEYFDKNIDWENPLSGSLWSEEERAIFIVKSLMFYSNLKAELGVEYEVVNEVSI